MKTTNKRNDHNLPVSRNFYARLKERIATILTAIGQPGNTDSAVTHTNSYILDKMMEAVRLYMLGCEGLVKGTMPAEIYYVIFLSLKAEIDTAITRSLRAREAAMRRRAAKLASTLPIPDINTESGSTTSESDSGPKTINTNTSATDSQLSTNNTSSEETASTPHKAAKNNCVPRISPPKNAIHKIKLRPVNHPRRNHRTKHRLR